MLSVEMNFNILCDTNDEHQSNDERLILFVFNDSKVLGKYCKKCTAIIIARLSVLTLGVF